MARAKACGEAVDDEQWGNFTTSAVCAACCTGDWLWGQITGKVQGGNRRSFGGAGCGGMSAIELKGGMMQMMKMMRVAERGGGGGVETLSRGA